MIRSRMRSTSPLGILHLAVNFFLSSRSRSFALIADWGSSSDTLSDALSFSPLNIALVVHFLVSLRSRSFVKRIGDPQVSY